MTIKLLCAIGIHAWESHPMVYEDQMELDLDIPKIPPKRICSCCGKKQTLTSIELNLFTCCYNKAWRDTNE